MPKKVYIEENNLMKIKRFMTGENTSHKSFVADNKPSYEKDEYEIGGEGSNNDFFHINEIKEVPQELINLALKLKPNVYSRWAVTNGSHVKYFEKKSRAVEHWQMLKRFGSNAFIVDTEKYRPINENTFEKWFGNSILKDEEGKPLKMYHGTDAEFPAFSKEHIGKTGSYEGYGFNFTPYYGRAASYNSKNVIEAYLKVEHPLTTKDYKITPYKLVKIIAEIDEGKPFTDTIVAAYEPTKYGEKWDEKYYKRALPVAAMTIYKYNKENDYGDAGIYAEICVNGNGDKIKVIDVFEKLGYDSAIFYNDGKINTVVVFEPNQIKLTTNKTFNNDSDIMGEDIDFDNHGMSINNEKILDKYNLKNLVLSKNGNYVTLNKIVAKELGKGYGSKFMEELAKIADKNGWILALTPDASFGGTSTSRLKNFYKKFGFVANKGKNTDFSTRETMIRKPITENIEAEVEASEVNLDSFKKRETLAPRIWDGLELDPRARLRLLDIADDFWEFTNINWVKRKGIRLTGSICNYNWSKYSDIDLHIVVDFSEIDDRKDFVQEYFNSKKNEWNNEHSNLKIYGYPVELYVEDVDAETESGGIYDLEDNSWIKKPSADAIKQIGLDKYEIKTKSAKLMTLIDDLQDEFNSTDDDAKLREIGKKAHRLLNRIKRMRKFGLSRGGESDPLNIAFKVLRRSGYMDSLWELSSELYDKLNSIGVDESKILEIAKRFIRRSLNEEVVADGNSSHNPFKERWKHEREALKNYLVNYGEIMTSKENGKQYKVLYDSSLSSKLGINYCICIQWNQLTMEPGEIIYVRAFDKFTRRLFKPEFDTRGFDNDSRTKI